jgi:hypothetical protein
MIEYVKEMRKIIGTRPLLVCGASVSAFPEEQMILEKNLKTRLEEKFWKKQD